jgi:hypothetical protein
LDCRILSSMPGSFADFLALVSGATFARKVKTFFVVSVLPAAEGRGSNRKCIKLVVD